MRISIVRLTVVILFGLVSHYSFAAGTSVVEEFVVSGVLRKNADEVVIKLVHKVGRASSAIEVVVEFKNEVQDRYPDYSLIEVIASPVNRQVQVCKKYTAI